MSQTEVSAKTGHQDVVKILSTEEILNIEKDIQSLIERKRRADMSLIDMEARIYLLEGEHLKETSQFGTIVQGLEGYLGGITGGTGGTHSSHRRHIRDIKDTERVFSNTSTSSVRALAVHTRLVREGALEAVILNNNNHSTSSFKKNDSSSTSSQNSNRHRSHNGSSHRRKRTADPDWETPEESLR